MSEQDKQRAIEALERAGFRHDARGHSWVRAGQYPDMPDIAGPSADKVCLTLMVSVGRLPALLNPITMERAEQAKQAVMAELDGQFWEEEELRTEDALSRLIARLFPEEAPTDASPTGGNT